ncbi:serine hydrolase domain-containing protein [Paenibacillus popilliae]|uniref:serine hydrolase domain-containing protein n=1 Tax=Paenibacillus popilliae TaxID=78057 RepID=UPI0028B0820A|nr:serine hydrolase domain-containing protein [Paenibacillus sp. SDF0028]
MARSSSQGMQAKTICHTQITPCMLLNHSSGLHGYIGPNSTMFDDHDTYAHDTLLEELAAQDLQADPGAYSVYNNVGFSLAEILVERVSSMDFTAFIHKYFTVPLQMNNTKTSQDSVNLFPFNQYGIKAITKGGDTASYHSSLVVLPEYNMSAAVVSSGGSSATDQLLATELLLSALQEKEIIKERKSEKCMVCL